MFAWLLQIFLSYCLLWVFEKDCGASLLHRRLILFGVRVSLLGSASRLRCTKKGFGILRQHHRQWLAALALLCDAGAHQAGRVAVGQEEHRREELIGLLASGGHRHQKCEDVGVVVLGEGACGPELVNQTGVAQEFQESSHAVQDLGMGDGGATRVDDRLPLGVRPARARARLLEPTLLRFK